MNTNPYTPLLGAINGIRTLIIETYPDGGWLPGGRDMAKRLDVGHSTYRKALKFLENEGWVKSFPKKGHYVMPDYIRCHKIGFIVDNGGMSSFFHMSHYIGAAFSRLNEAGYSVQEIQATSLDQLHETATIFGVEGLIWFHPSTQAIDTIREMRRLDKIPVLVVPNTSLSETFEEPIVTYDSQNISKARAKFMLERGHRNLAFVGKPDSVEYETIRDILREAGCDLPKTHCASDLEGAPESIIEIIRLWDTTGIISIAGPFETDLLFARLEEHHNEFQPEVLSSYMPQLASIHKKHPNVNLIRMRHQLTTNIGDAAACALIEHLREGKPLRSVRIGLNQNNEVNSYKTEGNI